MSERVVNKFKNTLSEKAKESAELEELTKEYLEKGNIVEHIPIGVSRYNIEREKREKQELYIPKNLL